MLLTEDTVAACCLS